MGIEISEIKRSLRVQSWLREVELSGADESSFGRWSRIWGLLCLGVHDLPPRQLAGWRCF